MNSHPETAALPDADEVERHPCPRCAVQPGSPCRTRSGAVTGTYHTARFTKVPRLAKELRVPTPGDRGPGQPWRSGPPPPAPIPADTPSADIRIGYARCSHLTQELQSQLDALAAAGIGRGKIFAEKVSTRVRVRPEFEKALEACRQIKAHAPHCRVILTVYEMKRLGRDSAELTALADHLTAHGIGVQARAGWMGWRTSRYSAAGRGGACVQAGLSTLWPDGMITLGTQPRQGTSGGLAVLRPATAPGPIPAKAAERVKRARRRGTAVLDELTLVHSVTPQFLRPLPEPSALPDGVLPSDAEYGDEDVLTYAVRLPVEEAGGAAVSGRGGQPRINRSIPGVTSLPAISRDTWNTHPDPAGRAAAQADVARFLAQRYPVLDRLNPTGNELNCNGAVLAVDYMLDGHTTVRLPPASTPDFYGAFRLKDKYQGRWVTVVSYDGVIDKVQKRPGSRGVVYISHPDTDGFGHLFNVHHTDDGVVFLDGQAGTLAELPANAKQIGLLLYHPDDQRPAPAHRSTVPATSIDRPPLPTGPQPPRRNDAHTVLLPQSDAADLNEDIADEDDAGVADWIAGLDDVVPEGVRQRAYEALTDTDPHTGRPRFGARRAEVSDVTVQSPEPPAQVQEMTGDVGVWGDMNAPTGHDVGRSGSADTTQGRAQAIEDRQDKISALSEDSSPPSDPVALNKGPALGPHVVINVRQKSTPFEEPAAGEPESTVSPVAYLDAPRPMAIGSGGPALTAPGRSAGEATVHVQEGRRPLSAGIHGAGVAFPMSGESEAAGPGNLQADPANGQGPVPTRQRRDALRGADGPTAGHGDASSMRPSSPEPLDQNAQLSESQQTELLANAIDTGSLDGLAVLTAGMTPKEIEDEGVGLRFTGTPEQIIDFLREPNEHLRGDYHPWTLAVLDAQTRRLYGRSLQDFVPGIAGMWLGWRAEYLAASGRQSHAVELVNQVRNRPAALSAIVHAQALRRTGFILGMGVRFPDVRALSDEIRDLVGRGESRAAALLIAGIEHDTLSLLALADVYFVTNQSDLFVDVPELAARVRAVPAEPAAATPPPGRPLNAVPHRSYYIDQLERAVWGMVDHQEADIDFRIAVEPTRPGGLARGDLSGVLMDTGHVWLEIRLPLGRDAEGRPRHGRVFSVGFAPEGQPTVTRAQETALLSPDIAHVPAASVPRTITPRDLRAAIVFIRSVQNRPYFWLSNNCVTFANELSTEVFGGARPFRGLAARVARPPREHRVPRPQFPASAASSDPPLIEKADLSGDNAARRANIDQAVRAFVKAYIPQLVEHLRADLPAPPIRISVASPPTSPLGHGAMAASLKQATELQRTFQKELERWLELPTRSHQIVYGEIPIQLQPLGTLKDPTGTPVRQASFEMFVPPENAARLRAVPIPEHRRELIRWADAAEQAIEKLRRQTGGPTRQPAPSTTPQIQQALYQPRRASQQHQAATSEPRSDPQNTPGELPAEFADWQLSDAASSSEAAPATTNTPLATLAVADGDMRGDASAGTGASSTADPALAESALDEVGARESGGEAGTEDGSGFRDAVQVDIQTVRRVLEKLSAQRYQELLQRVRAELSYSPVGLTGGVFGDGAPLEELPAAMHDGMMRRAYELLRQAGVDGGSASATATGIPEAAPSSTVAGVESEPVAGEDPVGRARSKWQTLVDERGTTTYADHPERAVAAAERVAERLRRGQPPLSFDPDAPSPGLLAGREFGMEVEVAFQDTADWENTVDLLAADLRRAGLTQADRIAFIHSSHETGYTRNPGDWRIEREHIEWQAELISPISQDEPRTWQNLQGLLDIVRRRGGKGRPNRRDDGTIGGHVHVSTGDFGLGASAYHALLALFKAHEDVLFRLATNPRAGEHRGGSLSHPARAFRISSDDSIEDLSSRSVYPLALSFSAVKGGKSDHVEWRLWDGSVDPAEWQIRARLSVAITEAALRLAEDPDLAERLGSEPLGTHLGTERQELYAGNYQGDRMIVYRPDEQEVRSLLRLLDLVFTRDEDKDRVLELFALTTWATDTGAWAVPQGAPELSWTRPETALVMTKTPSGIALAERPFEPPRFARDALGTSAFSVWTYQSEGGRALGIDAGWSQFYWLTPRRLASLLPHAGWRPGQAVVLSGRAAEPVTGELLQRAANLSDLLATPVYIAVVPQWLDAHHAEQLRRYQIFADPATPVRVDSAGVGLPQTLLRYTPAPLTPEPGPLGNLVETPIDLTQMIDPFSIVEGVGDARARLTRAAPAEPGPSLKEAFETAEVFNLPVKDSDISVRLHEITRPAATELPASPDPAYFADLTAHVKGILRRRRLTPTDRSDGWLEATVRDRYALLNGVQRRDRVDRVAAYIVHDLASYGFLAARLTLGTLGDLVERVSQSGTRPPGDEVQACLSLVTELIRQAHPDGIRPERPIRPVDDVMVGTPAGSRYLHLPPDQWGPATSWAGLIGQVPQGGAVVVVFARPGRLGHALALIDTIDGVQILNPQAGGLNVHPAPQKEDADTPKAGMPALLDARALTIESDGTLPRPTEDQSESANALVEALIDPTDSRIGGDEPTRRAARQDPAEAGQPAAVTRGMSGSSAGGSPEQSTIPGHRDTPDDGQESPADDIDIPEIVIIPADADDATVNGHGLLSEDPHTASPTDNIPEIVTTTVDADDTEVPTPAELQRWAVPTPPRPTLRFFGVVAEEEAWRYFIDARDHAAAREKFPSTPGYYYDSDKSPGFQEAILRMFRDVLDRTDPLPLGWNIYESLHDRITGGVQRDFGRNGVGTKMGRFQLGAPRPAADILDEVISGRPLISSQEGVAARLGADEHVEPLTVYRRHFLGPVHVYTLYTADEIPALIDDIFETYRTKISSAVSDLERILAISWVIRVLHVLHPFVDGNGRLNITVLLTHLLLQHGFHPVITDKMHVMFNGGYSLPQTAAILLRGQPEADAEETTEERAAPMAGAGQPVRTRTPRPYVDVENGIPWFSSDYSALDEKGEERPDRRCVEITLLTVA